ncbi:MAG: sugar phosphate isomerase/epimerase [Oscillospiraceae bacterium]|nr:sugar phosphate isomerase/epimerase [Oscillospiraceae bacterium]
MILGICGWFDEKNAEDTFKMLKNIGYVYIEAGIHGYYKNEKYLETVLKALDNAKIRCEVGQHPFPGEYNPDGEQTEEALEKIRDYFYELLSSTSDLNLSTLVMGGGGARFLPSPDKYENVVKQIADICKYAISPVLDEFGIILALEALRKDETSMLNRTDESVKIAKLANTPNIKVMADLYHVIGEGENLDDFVNYKGCIRHAHIGKPSPRVMPSENDGYDYKPFFEALRSANFNGRMSVEAGSSCDDYKTSLERAFAVLQPLL